MSAVRSELMNPLENLLLWLTLAALTILCGFVFASKVQKVLPFFAAYSSMLLASAVSVWLVYRMKGFNSLAAYYCYWISLLLNAGMRSLAIAELCRYKLRAYRGIWELVWRVLAGLSMLFLLHAAFDAWGQPNHLAIYSLTLDRDLDIASVAILATLLLIHNYYGLSLEPLQRSIAAGICLICAVDVIGDTTVRNLFTGYLLPYFATDQNSIASAVSHFYGRINDLWGTIHLFWFMTAIGIWCYALRKQVPARAEAPELLPAEVYRELSPAINMRLATFNDRLTELLKP
jgi:hypothetical protein